MPQGFVWIDKIDARNLHFARRPLLQMALHGSFTPTAATAHLLRH
jgi:hypothetical protein